MREIQSRIALRLDGESEGEASPSRSRKVGESKRAQSACNNYRLHLKDHIVKSRTPQNYVKLISPQEEYIEAQISIDSDIICEEDDRKMMNDIRNVWGDKKRT